MDVLEYRRPTVRHETPASSSRFAAAAAVLRRVWMTRTSRDSGTR